MADCTSPYGKMNHLRSKLVVFMSVRQREVLFRILNGEEITMIEATKAFTMKSIKKYTEAGLWVVVRPTHPHEPYRVRKEHPAIEA
jgi:hypothetical protein